MLRNLRRRVTFVGAAFLAAISSPCFLAAQEKPIQFTNVTEAAGIRFRHFKGNQGISINLEEFGPGVCVADFDGDGWPDIYFVNARDRYDRGINVQNALYRNNGDGTFTDVTDKAKVPGTGFGLGCVWGDSDNDGHPDLFITQYGRNVLYHNNGDGTFTDVTDKAGVAGMDVGTWFHSGATFLDYDRDGKLDLYVGGYVAFGANAQRYCNLGGVTSSCPPSVYEGSANILEQVSPEIRYRQSDTLFHNDGHGKFTDVSKNSGDTFQTSHVGRGVAFADFDNDGYMDVVVAGNNGPPFLLHDDGGNGHHFVCFRLVGTKSNRDAMGARLKLTAGGITQIREIMGGGSYLSQSDLRAHFGVGSTTKIDKLEIAWPSGAKQSFQDFAADHFYQIAEGKDELAPEKIVRSGANRRVTTPN